MATGAQSVKQTYHEFFWAKTCGNKRAHSSEQKAWAEARRLEVKYGQAFNHYFCVNCASWHCGHDRGKR